MAFIRNLIKSIAKFIAYFYSSLLIPFLLSCSQAQLPLSQRRVPDKIPATGAHPVLYKLSETNSHPPESLVASEKKDSPTLNLYTERPGSLADLLEKDKYNPRPRLSECEANNDFG